MDFKESDKWNSVYRDFRRYYPSIERDCVDWWPAGYEKITAILNDGTKLIFNNIDHSFRNVDRLKERTEDDDEEWKKEFRRRLRTNMIDSCCDQEKLARLVGISQGTMSNYLTGKTLPDVLTFVRIAEATQTPVEELLYFY